MAGVVVLYTTLLLAWTLSFWLPSGRQLPLQATAVIGSWFYLPMWILAVLALVRCHYKAIIILLIPLALFLHDYGRYYLPRWPTLTTANAATEPVRIGKSDLRVMTWNSYFRNGNGNALVSTMHEVQPDVVAIQELGYGIVDTLHEALQTQYPYQLRFPADEPSGMALLSRYPILRSSLPAFGEGECNCLMATIDVDGRPVTILNTHPWPPQLDYLPGDFWGSLRAFSMADQDQTFDALLAAIATIDEPLLLLGDFNTTERQYNYQRVAALLTDAYAEAGWGIGYTFPTVKRVYGIPVFPILRLDYIFHDESWHTDRIWRGTIDGSDHRYLVADLLLE